MSEFQQTNILTLPTEILVTILQHLSYKEIDLVRATCKSFNRVGVYLQSLGLHRLRLKADYILSNFIKAEWFRTNHVTAVAKRTYDQRINKGAVSLMILTLMIRTADASTYPFIQEGILPSFPGPLLEDISKALSLASRRNPLVGKKRLESIFNSMTKYFKSNTVPEDKYLSSGALFKSITDLLDSLPVRTEELIKTPWGLHLSCQLPHIPLPQEPSTVAELSCFAAINILMALGMYATRMFVDTDQSNFINIDFEVGQLLLVSEVQLSVACGFEDRASVTSLQELGQLHPHSFRLTLAGSRPNTDKVEVTHSYTSPNWDPTLPC